MTQHIFGILRLTQLKSVRPYLWPKIHKTLCSFFASLTTDYDKTMEFCKVGMYANLVILATPVCIIGHQVVCLGHLGGFVAF